MDVNLEAIVALSLFSYFYSWAEYVFQQKNGVDDTAKIRRYISIDLLIIVNYKMLKTVKLFQLLIIFSVFFACSSSEQPISGEETKKQEEKSQVPQILWSYWEGEVVQAPVFTQMCLNNFEFYAHKSNWKFNIINSTSIYNYISQQSVLKLNFIKDKKKDLTPNNLADLYKVFVLYENGGLWLDCSNVLVSGLQWVTKMQEKQSTQAQIIIFNDYHGNSGYKQTVFPPIDLGILLAKPLSKLLGDIIEQITEAHSLNSIDDFYAKNEKKGYRYAYQKSPLYFYGSYQFQTVLQKKQQELQNPAQQFYKIRRVNEMSHSLLLQLNQWIDQCFIYDFSHQSLGYLHQFGQEISLLKLSYQQTVKLYHYLQKTLKDTENKCFTNISSFTADSLLSQFLLKHSQHLEFVQRLNAQYQELSQGKCAMNNEAFSMLMLRISHLKVSLPYILCILIAAYGFFISQKQLKGYILQKLMRKKQVKYASI